MNRMQDYRIRRAAVSDGPSIAGQRVRMFHEMGELSLEEMPVVEAASRARLADEIAAGAYVGWLVEAEGHIVAGAGIVLHAYYPTGANPYERNADESLTAFRAGGKSAARVKTGWAERSRRGATYPSLRPRDDLHRSTQTTISREGSRRRAR
jgi:hypothetical protein